MGILNAIQYLQEHHPVEAQRLLVCLGLVVAYYLASGGALLLLFVTGRRRGRAATRSRLRLFCIAVVSGAVAGLAALSYAYFIEPYWLEAKVIPITSGKLTGALRPLRIVQISDLHCEDDAGPEMLVPEIIAEMKPDLIVFTGDSANSKVGLHQFKTLMRRISKLAPTFAVTGNWEAGQWSQMQPYKDTGMRTLDAEAVPLTIAGERLWVAGVPCDHQAWGEAIKDIPAGEFSIFLDHYADRIYDVSPRGIDLYLSGQTHGGQIRLPWLGALVTFSQYGEKFQSGLYRVKDTWLYVNHGVGMTGGEMPRLRFLARPEVTLFQLSAERNSR